MKTIIMQEYVFGPILEISQLTIIFLVKQFCNVSPNILLLRKREKNDFIQAFLLNVNTRFNIH